MIVAAKLIFHMTWKKTIQIYYFSRYISVSPS